MKNSSTSLTKLTLQKFKRNSWGVFSFIFLCACTFLALFAYVLAPDDSKNANQMHLSIHSKSPGFKVKMLKIPYAEEEQNFFSEFFIGKKNTALEIPISDYIIQDDLLRITEYNDEGVDGIIKDYPSSLFFKADDINKVPELYIAEKHFLLGTDKYGRDLLSRMLIGIRISLAIGFVSVFISLIIGISMGAIAGYFGGKVDAVIMWIINVTWSIPTLLLVIAITLALGKGFWQVFIAVGLTMWVEVARIVRGQVMSVKQMQYVNAAKALGFNNFRIITKHILPNSMAPVTFV